jgi:hypothetical protein
MDRLTIISTVLLAVYNIAGIVLIVWAICAVCKLNKGRR